MTDTVRIITILLVMGINSTSATAENSENIGVVIQNGQFLTREGVIPAGCFAQLITEMNGDNSIASVFVHRAYLRGCMDSNYPYPGGNEDKVRYSIEKQIHPNLFALNVCVASDGSMGGTCDQLLVDFSYRNYVTEKGVRPVLTLNKVGDWQ
ncbi:hypothetical protein N8913_04465 [Litoricola sp.]|nr:hypothetical protein [Litorivicinus sp.]